MIGVGIDFGTSNSAAAWYDGKVVRLIPLEESDDIMPTATHLDRELRTEVGEAAVQQYIEENRDRIVELTPEIVGRSQLLVGDRDIEDPNSEAEIAATAVYGQPNVDRGMPGRLFRGVKRLLGNASIKRLLVFNHPFRIVALITPVLLHIRKCIESAIPEALQDVHVGHPVKFEGHDEQKNQLALSRLGEACDYAGFNELSFYPEPVAATLSYLYDDLSVVEFSGLEFSVLSTAGAPLGGEHIDQIIFREMLFPMLGKGEIWSRVKDGVLIENEFPFDEFEDRLLNWAVTYTLNQNYYRSKVADCIRKGGAAAEKFERLDDLITHNYSYLVFQAIKDAKAELSSVEETVLDIPELDVSITFNRDQFETMMKGILVEIDEIVDKVIADAGCSTADIDVVIRTGGSSQIAAVRRMLAEKFPGKVTEHDPFTSVAAGLAIASFHGYAWS
jgi:hypothetical chaperone protein